MNLRQRLCHLMHIHGRTGQHGVVKHYAPFVRVERVNQLTHSTEARRRPPDMHRLEARVERDSFRAQRLHKQLARKAKYGGIELEAEFVEGGRGVEDVVGERKKWT